MKLIKLAALSLVVLNSQAAFSHANAGKDSTTVDARVEFVAPLTVTGTNIEFGVFTTEFVASDLIYLNPIDGKIGLVDGSALDSDLFDADHGRGSLEVSGWSANDLTGSSADSSYNPGIKVWVTDQTHATDTAFTTTVLCSSGGALITGCTKDYSNADLAAIVTAGDNTIDWNLGGQIDFTGAPAPGIYTAQFEFTAAYY